MQHKLLIVTKGPLEIVRRAPFQLSVSVKNLGDVDFGGGKIVRVHIDQPPNLTGTPSPEQIIVPPLKPQESSPEILLPEIVCPMEGFAWFYARIEANDSQPVEHYQSIRFSTGEDWRYPVYISSRESARIIALLERVLAVLEKKQQSGA